jgi:small conductance mechanosensitive channel
MGSAMSSFIGQINVESIIWFLQRFALAGVIIAVTWLATKIIGGIISKALGLVSSKVAVQVRRITSAFIWLVGIVQALDQLGLDPTLLLMIIGIVGLAAITAFRDVFPSIAFYNLIVTYDLFKIGDWIEVDGYFGRVVKLTWMNTVLITRDNEMVHIPNSRIIKGNLVNRTVQGGIRVAVPLTVDRRTSLYEVERILLEVGEEFNEVLAPGFIPEVRVTNLDEDSLKVELLLRISNPARDDLVTSEVLKKTLMKLEEAKKVSR